MLTRNRTFHNRLVQILILAKTPERPLSLQEAAAIGDVNAIRALFENGGYVEPN